MTTQQRSKNMAAIKGKDTKPEKVVRKYLWARGFRYRLNHPRLPGKPDIVLLKYRTCIFVNGCFWHGHMVTLPQEWNEAEAANISNSDCCKIPKTNRRFWVEKLMRNQTRDIEVQRQLATMGWHSVTVWECELRPALRQATLDSLAYTLNHIFLQDHKSISYYVPDEEESTLAAEDECEYKPR